MKNRNRIATMCIAAALAVTTPVMAASENLIMGNGEEDVNAIASESEEEWGWDLILGTGEDLEDTGAETQMLMDAGNTADLSQALAGGISYLANTITSPVVNTIGGEWSVMAMARNGSLSGETENNYRVNLGNTLEQVNGKLHGIKYTEYSRVIMALSSIGIDAHNVNGYDLIQPLADFSKVKIQGINGPVYALIALDTRGYEVPVRTPQQKGEQTSREGIISYILSNQLSEGGWALSGNNPDDLTPMTIQALAPYYGRADVKAAVDKALERWSGKQQADGGYGSSDWGGGSETISQTIIALSALNIDLSTDSRFIKNGYNLLDALLSYQLPDGSFEHIKGQGSDLMATDQSTLAMTAYNRFLNGQTRLYDMSDVPLQGGGEESSDEVTIFRNRLYHIPDVPTLADRDEIMSLDAELGTMGDFPEKEEFAACIRGFKDEIKRQQEEVKALDQYIWDHVQPAKITLQDKKAVEEARTRYTNLPKENREFLQYASDIADAENELLKLENGGSVFAGLLEVPAFVPETQGTKETAKAPAAAPAAAQPARRPGALQAAGGNSKGPAPSPVKTETVSNTVDAKAENGVVTAEALEGIKGQEKNLKVEGELEKDQKYAVTLHGKDIETAQDMNTKLSKGSEFEEDIYKLAEDPFIFHFEEKEKFPGPAQIELPVSLENGEYLLLKYNSTDRQAELVQKITVEDGQTKFIVSEGGDYFIAKKAKSQSLNELEKEEKEEKQETVKEKEKKAAAPTETPAEECDTDNVAEEEETSSPWPVVAGVVAVVVLLVAGINFWLNKKRGLR